MNESKLSIISASITNHLTHLSRLYSLSFFIKFDKILVEIKGTAMPEINTIVSLLEAVQSMGASDIFLSEGKPPSARINGAVRRLKHTELTKSTLSIFLIWF